MQEERRMILRMLEEGKLTAAEAEALLAALGDGSAEAKREVGEEPWSHLEIMGAGIASVVAEAAERFSRSLEHTLGEGLAKLPRLVVSSSEAHPEHTQVVRGPVGPGQVLPVSLSNVNGPIRVQGWSEDCYQLTVVQRMRGRSRDALDSHLYEVDWEDNAVKDEFRLNVPDFGDRSVSLHLMVPQSRMYEVRLTSHNGSLRVENLQATTLTLETVNGSMGLRSVTARSIQGRGENGSCAMEGVEAESIRHELGNGSFRISAGAREMVLTTTNGSINARLAAVTGCAEHRLRTSHGSVRVSLPRQGDLGVELDLETSIGRVSTDLEDLEIIEHKRSGGGTALKARTAGNEASAHQLRLEASSVTGSITVSN